MDFYQVKERSTRNGVIEVYPDFRVCRSKDLMVRGKSFYAIWDEERQLWSTDEYDVQRLVDQDLLEYKNKILKKTDGSVQVKLLSEYSTKSWAEFKSYISNISDNSHDLDEQLTFSNTPVCKKDYVSKKLPYPLEKGSHDAFDEIISTLYDEEERAKLEWAIGAIVSGDSRDIQKFMVLYGEAGAGKSTMLNIIQQLFEGYYTAFEAKALTSSSNAFSTEVFKANPLVAIQHDGDLSRIEDNTKLNSIVSHEMMTMNEKYKPSYMSRANCFLFVGTNKPVKITDAKSGVIRRLIDVTPSYRKIPPKRYQALMNQIGFELGAIAYHCLEVYREMGKNYYSSYRPLSMILQTDVFFNFVEANFCTFKEQDTVTLSQAYEMYKTYCDESLVDFKLPRYKFREELKSYFKTFSDIARVDGKQIRSCYSGFLSDKFSFTAPVKEPEEHQASLVLDCTESLFDKMCSECIAQYGNANETPAAMWSEVTTKLSELDTGKLHYVMVPLNHIVIDFDLTDDNGNKCMEKNLDAASKWPATYAEFSKGGNGIHLHYIYDGDPERLSRVFSPGIEVKVFTGNASLRRRLSKCNNIPIATINCGLPLKGEKMINFEAVKSEKKLRELIGRNLNKEIHPGTKPSIDFIYKLLDDAYKAGVNYDVTDMRPKILAFANNSSHQADYCVKLVCKMPFKSETISEPSPYPENKDDESDLVFYDVEVYPNLFLLVYKVVGPQNKCVRMYNPTPQDIELFLKTKNIGFNNRRYDNHIVYARYLGYTNEQLFQLSQRIINGSRNALFSEAYNLSYTDIYDFSSKKQSLKKFEIELGLHHHEMDLPWDQPVPEELWPKVGDYCENDVLASEATFFSRKADWIARKILAKVSKLSVNDSTQQHVARIIFGNDPRPQDKFIYTDLSEMFPGYKFENGKSYYRDEEIGEGGYVYAEPGMYINVALLDIESMHPHSAKELEIFGPYTARFVELMEARLAVKHEDHEKLEVVLEGVLLQVMSEFPDLSMDDLSYALKIAINIVYGLTSAKFENKFKDPRNVDNIVAKRGELFMVDLKHAVQEKGFTVAHIKTDSIKIPNATPEIIEFVKEYGKRYGYNFDHEATYSKMCLVNNAVYIAKYATDEWCKETYGYIPKDCKKHPGEWTATGAQFAHPYVFKTLFSKDPIEFKDMCEARSVTSAMYLDFNEGLSEEEHSYVFVGKTGLFCPIKPGCGGAELLRKSDEKYHSVGGAKGYRWMESELVEKLGLQDNIDLNFFRELVDASVNSIGKYGDFEWFVSEDLTPLVSDTPEAHEYKPPCGNEKYQTCFDCPHFDNTPYDFDCAKGYQLSQEELDAQLPF